MRIGISGWRYKGWRGKFYSPGLPQKDELASAACKFNTVEINGTFYSLQQPASFVRWAAETPDNFQFAVKGSRFITHMRKLRDIEVPLANFFASGVLLLGRKLGPFLWQFGPNFRFEPERLSRFFELLPRNTDQALALARRHDKIIETNAGLKVKGRFRFRHAIEIRHNSFAVSEFIALLRKYDVALVCADTGKWPLLMDVTSDFVYVRLHGSNVLYRSGYEDVALDTWATRVVAWAQGGEPEDARHASPQAARSRRKRDVYVYFDNDAKARAPADALALKGKAGGLLSKPRSGR